MLHLADAVTLVPASAAASALTLASAGADSRVSAVDNPLVSAPSVINPPQSTFAADAFSAILAAPLPNDQRDPVHLVSPLPRPNSASASPSVSLVGVGRAP